MRTMQTALAALAAVPLALGLVAAGEPEFEQATETLYISAGCVETTPGQCTSTRWLGTQTGDSTTNYLTSTLPVDGILYHVEGPNWRDYASSKSKGFAEDGYLLDTTRPLEVDVTLRTGGNGGVMVNDYANMRATLNHCEKDAAGAFVGCRTTVLNGEEQTVTLVGISESTVVEWDLALDPAVFEGRWVRSAQIDLAVQGINAQGGYIDQQGGSPVRLPHLVEIEAEPAA